MKGPMAFSIVENDWRAIKPSPTPSIFQNASNKKFK